MEKNVIKFTYKDIACEAAGQLCQSFDPIGAAQIVLSGLRYNNARESGDEQRVLEAYKQLHPELRLFKHNFLSRGKKHW